MKKIDVEVLIAHTYDHRWRVVGEVYSALPKFAKPLALLGKVKYYVPKPEPKKPDPKPKRQYTRRDITVKDKINTDMKAE